MDPGRAAEVHSVNMDFFMDKDQRLERALANNDVTARTLEGDSDVQISGSNSLEVTVSGDERQQSAETDERRRSLGDHDERAEVESKRSARRKQASDRERSETHLAQSPDAISKKLKRTATRSCLSNRS